MKHALAIMLAVSFTALAVFGVFAMHHDMESGHMGCLATATAAQTCPLGGALSIFLFHAESFKYFSLALGVTFLLSLVVAIVALQHSLSDTRRTQNIFLYHRHRQFAYFLFSPARIMRWLSLHENSPSRA